jgi:hypothetical protein
MVDVVTVLVLVADVAGDDVRDGVPGAVVPDVVVGETEGAEGLDVALQAARSTAAATPPITASPRRLPNRCPPDAGT